MDINEALFAPFDRRYCNWFYAWMCVNLVFLVAALISFAVPMKMDARLKGFMMSAFFPAILGYINSRMWYSMCLR